jgi:hypothetical protein
MLANTHMHSSGPFTIEETLYGSEVLVYSLARSRPDQESLRLVPSRHDGVNRVLELTDVGSVIRIVSDSRPHERGGR